MSLTECELVTREVDTTPLVLVEMCAFLRWPFGQLENGISISVIEVNVLFTDHQVVVLKMKPSCIIDLVGLDSIVTLKGPVLLAGLEAAAGTNSLDLELFWLGLRLGSCGRD